MQEKIQNLKSNLDENITDIKIKDMPEYNLELVSGVENTSATEEKILSEVTENAEITCKVFTIKVDGKEKAYVKNKSEAEKIIKEIKENTKSDLKIKLEIEEQEKNNKEINEEKTDSQIAKLDVNAEVQEKVKKYEKKQIAARAAENRRKKAEQEKKTQSSSTGQKGASAKVTSKGMFMRPISGGTLTSPYGKRKSGFHTGIDLSSKIGTPIYAAASGTVIFAGGNPRKSYGLYIKIDHGNGYQTLYAHCSKLYVSEGQKVSKGENIGAVGSTGNSTGPHVHFEIKYKGNRQNPQNYI